MANEFDLTQEEDALEAAKREADFDDDTFVDDDTDREAGWTSRQKIILVSIGAAVLLSLLGLIIGLVLISGRSTDDDRILENVFAGGVDLSGMTVEEAISALHIATDQSYAKESMIVQIYDGTLTLPPDSTKVSLDVEAVAQTAYGYGRTGNQAENQRIRKNAQRRSHTIPLLPYLSLDLTLIRNTVDSYCATVDSEYSETVITLIGNRPTYGTQSPQHQSIRITLGTPLRKLDADDLYDKILDAYSMNQLNFEYETPEILWPEEVDAQTLFNQYCSSAQDAVLNPTTYEITAEVYGYGFHVNALQLMLDEARPGETIEIPMSFIEPTLLAQDIYDSLFRETLSTCSSTSAVDDNARDLNLQLACQAINGYVIKPGETFSFLTVLGNISEQAGYTEAPVCSNNDTSLGGGISQIASALYYCALHADLDITERHNHKYATDFIELGLDAYVNSGTNDLRFRNGTSDPIRIAASVNRSTVSVSLHSAKSLGYGVSIRPQITEKHLPSTTFQVVPFSNPQGYREGDIIVRGIDGYSVSISKEKFNIQSGGILSTGFVSIDQYQQRDEIIAKIGSFDAEIPTEPDQTRQPEETAPSQ